MNLLDLHFYFKVTFLFSCLVIIFSSCKKEEQRPEIPYVYVNFSIDPNSIEYSNLSAPGGFEYLTGGYKGILVYRLSISDFIAYERACPYDPLVQGARIQVDTSIITCSCPVCDSHFIITDGSPFSGPSPWPLKIYTTHFDGTLLYISN